MFEYRVVELKDGMLGGPVDRDKLEDALRKEAKDGWRCVGITPCDDDGKVTDKATKGVLVALERQRG